jgi:hypothetical protein
MNFHLGITFHEFPLGITFHGEMTNYHEFPLGITFHRLGLVSYISCYNFFPPPLL